MTMLNLDNLDKEILTVVSKYNLPEIKSQDDFASAGDFLKILKNKRKALEDFRLEITGPLTKQIKAIKAKFDKAGEPADQLIEKIEIEMKFFWSQEKVRVDAEQARLDAAAASTAGADGTLVPIVNSISSLRGDLASTSVRELTKYEVIDIDLVPRKFLMIDDKAVKAHIETGQKPPEGIKYITELSITSR